VTVSIGDNVLFGPAVQIYTATHPLNADERRRGLEYGVPITIGDRSVIGAGSVVTPSIAGGCRGGGKSLPGAAAAGWRPAFRMN
jgi:maltose O-acetyltransferase